MARVLGLAVPAAQGFHSRVIWGPWRKLHRRVMRPDLFLKGILFWLLVKNRFRGKVEAEVPAGRYWEKWSFHSVERGIRRTLALGTRRRRGSWLSASRRKQSP